MVRHLAWDYIASQKGHGFDSFMLITAYSHFLLSFFPIRHLKILTNTLGQTSPPLVWPYFGVQED